MSIAKVLDADGKPYLDYAMPAEPVEYTGAPVLKWEGEKLEIDQVTLDELIEVMDRYENIVQKSESQWYPYKNVHKSFALILIPEIGEELVKKILWTLAEGMGILENAEWLNETIIHDTPLSKLIETNAYKNKLLCNLSLELKGLDRVQTEQCNCREEIHEHYEKIRNENL